MQLTDEIYIASLSPALRVFFIMPQDKPTSGDSPAITARHALADTLAAKGFLVDGPIMVDGQDPRAIMQERHDYGYQWAPSWMMAVPSDLNLLKSAGPPGSIKVSVDAADYPPFPIPVPQAQPFVNTSMQLPNGWFYVTAAAEAANLQDGAEIQENGHWYLYHKTSVPSPFGPWVTQGWQQLT